MFLRFDLVFSFFEDTMGAGPFLGFNSDEVPSESFDLSGSVNIAPVLAPPE